MFLAPAWRREMPGRADAKIEQAVLGGKAPEKCGARQAQSGGAQEVALEGAGHLGMRDAKP